MLDLEFMVWLGFRMVIGLELFVFISYLLLSAKLHIGIYGLAWFLYGGRLVWYHLFLLVINY